MFTPFAFVKTTTITSSFSPSDITGLLAWWDAQTGVTTSGSDVTTWADQSGNGNDAEQATAANRPILTSSLAEINNKNAIKFNDVNVEFLSYQDSLFNGNINNSRTIFVVSKIDVNAFNDYGTFISEGGGGRTSVSVGPHQYATTENILNWATDNYAAGGVRTNVEFTENQWYITSWQWTDWADRATTSIYVNNSSSAALTTWGSAPLTPSTGSRNIGNFLDSGADSCINGMIAEIIVYSGSLSSANRESVREYLNTKYNIY